MVRRENSQRRRAARRNPRQRILVVCGAECTESQYLLGLRDSLDRPAVDIKIAVKPRAPAQVVKHAVACDQQSARDFDQIWCVVDADDFDITTAATQARRDGVDLVVSNPCFELWLLLHHEDCRTHLAGYDAVARRLRRHVAAYDKTRLEFRDYRDGLDEAISRAKALDPSGTRHEVNPSTGVWRLVERIME